MSSFSFLNIFLNREEFSASRNDYKKIDIIHDDFNFHDIGGRLFDKFILQLNHLI